MKNLSFYLCIFVLSPIFFEGCIEPVYIPSKVNAPLFHSAEHFYGSISAVANSGATAAIAYSPIESFYVGASGNITSGISPYQSDFSTKFFYGEIGGYKAIDPYVSFELALGYGLGASETYDDNSETNSYPDSMNVMHSYSFKQYDHTQMRYSRVHVQPTIAFHFDLGDERTNGWKNLSIELALSARVSFLNISHYDVDHFDSNDMITSTDQKHYQSEIYLEPAFTTRIGVEHLSLECQIGRSRFLGNPAQESVPAQTSFLSIGLVSRF